MSGEASVSDQSETNIDRESGHQEIRVQDIREPGHQVKQNENIVEPVVLIP